jgi:hypothetical protein
MTSDRRAVQRIAEKLLVLRRRQPARGASRDAALADVAMALEAFLTAYERDFISAYLEPLPVGGDEPKITVH